MFRNSLIKLLAYALLLAEIVSAAPAHPGYSYLPPKGGTVLSDEPPVRKQPAVQHDSQYSIQVDEPLDIRQPETKPVRDPFPAYNNYGTQTNFIPGTISTYPQPSGFGGLPSNGFGQSGFGGLPPQQLQQPQQQFLNPNYQPSNFGGLNYPGNPVPGFNPFIPSGPAGGFPAPPPTGGFFPNFGGGPSGPGGPPIFGPAAGQIGNNGNNGFGLGFPNIFRYPGLRVLADSDDGNINTTDKRSGDTIIATKADSTATVYGDNGGYLYEQPKVTFI